MLHRVRVWDLPLRLFHWALALCMVGLVVTAKVGGAAFAWHPRLGYVVATLLLFRLAWGFVGGHWARFARWLQAPRAALAYLQGRAHPDHLVGHNPLGAGSVAAMLLLFTAQAATGLVSDDEAGFTGPLNRFVTGSAGLAATSWHRGYGEWLVYGFVLLHVGAVLFHLRRGANLITPMVVGDKVLAQPARPSRDDAATRLGAAALLGLSAAAVIWLVRLGDA